MTHVYPYRPTDLHYKQTGEVLSETGDVTIVQFSTGSAVRYPTADVLPVQCQHLVDFIVPYLGDQPYRWIMLLRNAILECANGCVDPVKARLAILKLKRTQECRTTL